MRLIACLLALAAPAATQEQRVDRFRVAALIGQYIDLDSGTVLSKPTAGGLVADLRVMRRGTFFQLRPVGQAAAREGDRKEAPRDGYGPEPMLLQRGPLVAFVRTDKGRYAKVSARLSHVANNLAVLDLDWQYNRAGTRLFPKTAKRIDTTWRNGVLEVRWEGPAGRYRVTAEARNSRDVVEVSAARAKLTKLKPNLLHRVSVVRVMESGLLAVPVVASFLTGPRRVVIAKVAFKGRWYNRGGGLSLRAMKAFAEDADLIFYLYGVHAPAGGVRYVGRGEETFRQLTRLPVADYLPSRFTLQEGDVFAVRTKDGRYGKVMIYSDGSGSDFRHGMIAECVFLAGGGSDLPQRPLALRWEAQGGAVRLRWNAQRNATGYRVRRADDSSVVYAGREATCLLKGLPRSASVLLEVTALYEFEVESEPSEIRVHTYPERYRMGEFTLDVRGRTGFSFTQDRMDRGKAEIVILRAAGGASYLSISGPHGVGHLPRMAFGQMPAANWKAPGVTYQSRSSQQVDSLLWVRSKEGGIANVRIKRRRYPRVTFEYIYAAPLWSRSNVTLRGSRLEWGALKRVRAYVVRVNGKQVAETRETFCELPPLRRNAFHVIELSAHLEGVGDPNPLQISKHTFSKAFVLNKLSIQLHGRGGVSFSKNRPSTPGEEVELGMRLVDAKRILIRCPYGAEFSMEGVHGQFPALGTQPGLTREQTLSMDDLQKGLLLVRTADRGWASVKLLETQRWRQWQLDFVYRPPVTMVQARAALLAAAPRPDDEQEAKILRFLALLRENDPRARNQGLAGLTKLGLAPAGAMLVLRQGTVEPDLRRLVDRWVVETYERHLR